MANIVVKSGKLGIVVKELNTRDYKDETLLINDILRSIPEADGLEEGEDANTGVLRYKR